METGSMKRVLVIVAIIIFLAVGGYLFYCNQAAKTYEMAHQAFQDRDWTAAEEAYLEIQSTYRFSKPDRQESVKNYLLLIDSFQELQKAGEKTEYLKTIDSYNAFKTKFPDTYTAMNLDAEKIQYLINTLHNLHQEKQFEKAIALYRYMDSNAYLYDIENVDESDLAELYYDWALDLQNNMDYDDAIKKFELVRIWFNKYYDTKAIDEQIQSTHLLKANDLIDRQEFESAEAELVYIINQWPGTTTAENANSLYPSTVLQYAVELHENHDFQVEVEILEKTINAYPESDHLGELTDRLNLAYESYADQLMSFGEYYSAAVNYENVLDNTFDEVLISRISEKIQKTNAALLTDDGKEGQKILERIRDEFCSEDFDFPDIIEDVPKSANKAMVCPDVDYDLPVSQTAQSLAELRYVINMSIDLKEVQTCSYEDSYSLVRKQDHINIDVYDVTQQRLAKTTDLYGELPRRCPDTYTFTHQEQTIIGDLIEEAEIETWLNDFLP